MGAVEEWRPWSVAGAIGYTWYDFAYSNGQGSDPVAHGGIGDGQTPFGRFAIARDLKKFTFKEDKNLAVGLELGLQSGNIQRLDISQSVLDEIGGVPVQANIKPMLDLLATARIQPLSTSQAFLAAKAGIAYRRMQINETVAVNDLSQVAFEIQAGLGCYITERASLSLMYQGVFNGSTSFSAVPYVSTGTVTNIPQQNGLMLNVAYQL